MGRTAVAFRVSGFGGGRAVLTASGLAAGLPAEVAAVEG